MTNKYSVAKTKKSEKTESKAREGQRLVQAWVVIEDWNYLRDRALETRDNTIAAYVRKLIEKDKRNHARSQNR